MAKKSDQFRELARIGAAIRRAQLVHEMRTIDRAFPELRFQKRTAALLKTSGASVGGPVTTADEPARKTRKRRKLTAAEKKSISERMKKYWATRKRKET